MLFNFKNNLILWQSYVINNLETMKHVYKYIKVYSISVKPLENFVNENIFSLFSWSLSYGIFK